MTEYLLEKNCIHDIHDKYIKGLLKDEKNKIVFYCIDNDFLINNCPTIMVYQKYYNKDVITYYILLICTSFRFRNQGYASKLLDQFIDKIKKENKCQKPIKIVLSSLEKSVLFYEKYGFRWNSESISHHKILMNYEKYENDKEYFILELYIN